MSTPEVNDGDFIAWTVRDVMLGVKAFTSYRFLQGVNFISIISLQFPVIVQLIGHSDKFFQVPDKCQVVYGFSHYFLYDKALSLRFL